MFWPQCSFTTLALKLIRNGVGNKDRFGQKVTQQYSRKAVDWLATEMYQLISLASQLAFIASDRSKT